MKNRVMYVIMLSMMAWTHAVGQTVKKEFDKLIFLFIDEKYEKCASLGIKYTEDDELRRDPIPYLYVAMSNFEIAKDVTLDEKYPDAFKDALKYAYKYRKKDDNLLYWDRYENFFASLKDSANKLAQYYIAQEQFRKASSVYKYVNRFDPDDPIMQLWWGIADVKARNIGEGERNMTLAMEKIDDSYLPDKEILWVTSKGFEEYAAYMDSKGDYSGKRKGEQLAEKYKKFSPEEIEKQKKLEAEKNKPKREVKSFETDKETVENQKPKILGTSEKGEDAKKEIERIEQEQGKPKRQTRSFESNDDDDF